MHVFHSNNMFDFQEMLAVNIQEIYFDLLVPEPKENRTERHSKFYSFSVLPAFLFSLLGGNKILIVAD